MVFLHIVYNTIVNINFFLTYLFHLTHLLTQSVKNGQVFERRCLFLISQISTSF